MLHDDFETNFVFASKKESGAFRLIRTACKAYHKRGSNECGVAQHFNSFLSSRGETPHLESFVGNRFNVVFHNAAALYFHKESITNFFHAWPNKNNLLQAVNEDLSNKLFLAEVRALGIVDKLVTGPFWRIVENVNNILVINPYLLQLKYKLTDLCADATPVFNGIEVFSKGKLDYDGDLVNEDELYDKLFEDSGDDELDVMAIQALENVFHAILMVVERQAVDHLPGGIHYRPSEKQQAGSSNVPSHKASESEFAILDLLIRMKPNANIETLEMITMWYRNKTGDWLHQKSDTEKEVIMQEARKKVDAAKERLNLKRKILEERKLDILKSKQDITKSREEKSAIKLSIDLFH